MKRILAILTVVLMVLSSVPALGESNEAPIGVIGAMETEIALIQDSMEITGMDVISGMKFWRGSINGCPVVLVKCGEGKVNAAMAAQTLAVCYDARAIINTGVAGALDERLNVGDIVISTDAVQHDMNVTPLGYDLGVVPSVGYAAFAADADLIAKAAASAEKVAENVQVLQGRVCSGDQFVASREQKQTITQALGGACCEMEGASIAQVCALNKIPFVIIRAISDKADGSADVVYTEFEAEAAKRSAAIVLDMIGVKEAPVQYVLYLGTNDKDSNQLEMTKEEAMEMAKDILIKQLGGYTIQEANGGWIDDDGTQYQEYTLVIYLSDVTEEKMYEVAEELRVAFNQTAVLILGDEEVLSDYFMGN